MSVFIQKDKDNDQWSMINVQPSVKSVGFRFQASGESLSLEYYLMLPQICTPAGKSKISEANYLPFLIPNSLIV